MPGTMTGQANNSFDSYVYSVLGRDCCLEKIIVYSLIVGTLVVVGIIGNSITFFVFWKGNFQSSTSFLFLSLSLIDSALLLAVFKFVVYNMPAFVDYTGLLQSFSNIYAYLRVYVFPSALLAKTATIWVIVLIAINRFIIVCLPLRASQWCTVSKVKIQLVVVLIAAVLYLFIYLFMYEIPKFAECRFVHYITFTASNGTSKRTRVRFQGSGNVGHSTTSTTACFFSYSYWFYRYSFSQCYPFARSTR